MEEQWELHDSSMDSKKITEAIATNMTLKLAICESLLQSSNVLDSYSNFLTDKEVYINKINDVNKIWKELEDVVKTAKAVSQKEDLERKRTEIREYSEALSGTLDTIEHFNIVLLPQSSSETQKVLTQILTFEDMLNNNQRLLEDLRFMVRDLPEPHVDADAIFERWRKCRDTMKCNHELYKSWQDGCLMLERQSHFIEKKSELIPILVRAPKEICALLSETAIKEVEYNIKEVDCYKGQLASKNIEESIRVDIENTFQQHLVKLEDMISSVASAVPENVNSEAVAAPSTDDIATDDIVRVFDQIIYGDSPSLSVPILPGTSARRVPLFSAGVIMSKIATQKLLRGEYQVVVSSAVNPSNFYVQLVGERNCLKKLQEALNTTSLEPFNIKVQSECAAKFHDDGIWYRAEVKEIHAKGVLVAFIDYGNMQMCQVSDLRALPRSLLTPPCAFLCCLGGISTRRAWTDDESSKFCSIDGNQIHNATILKTVDGVHHIRLFRENRLVNLDFGMPEYRNVSQQLSAFNVIPWAPTAQSCSIVAFYSAEELYLKPSQAEEYQTQLEDMGTFYSSLLKDELLDNGDYQHGQPCVVKVEVLKFSEKSETFQRAMFQSDVNRNGEIKVFLIDTGNFLFVKRERVYRIVPEFLSFPALLWKCQIAGVKTVYAPRFVAEAAYSTVMANKELAVDCERVVSGVHHVKIHLSRTEDVASFLVKKEVVE